MAGDACAHPAIHGGPGKALLLIAEESLEELKAMGYPLYAGALGENVTTRGLDPASLRPGQRLRIGGEVEIELTSPRRPCNSLDVYGSSLKRDLAGPRAGFYAAVLRPGFIRPGDIITVEATLA
jgi:MOSC domain-containing protein YiiM